MAVNRFLRELEGLFNYSTDENPTTQQDYQEAVKNWVQTIESIVDCTLWQPETTYQAGDTVRTPSLPKYAVLICTVGGESGAAEPDYTEIGIGDSITDGTVTWKVDGLLPLSGGTITGVLTTTNAIVVKNATVTSKRDVTDSWNVVLGGTSDNDGAYLRLDGMTSNSAGSFMLKATGGTNNSYLVGYPDGTLEWAGISIERVRASGTYYIRFESGLQIVWGSTGATTAGKTVTFPVAFANTYYAVIPQSSGSSLTAGFESKTTTSVVIQSSHATAQAGIDYICIGRWK